MTVGIAAYGPEAGLAALKALRSIELVGRGAIGGFVSLAALTDDGAVARWETQTGGVATLLEEGPPANIAEARCAALMSSGPNRPDPLAAFVPASGGVGLVTGHRLPQTPSPDGPPYNVLALHAMEAGAAPEDAVRRVLEAFPEADAGLIAIASDGRLCAGDTARVLRRSDRGQLVMRSPDGDAAVAVSHNGVAPHQPLAQLAASVALDHMTRVRAGLFTITVKAACPVSTGRSPAVMIDRCGEARSIVVDDARLLSGAHAIGLGDSVEVFGGSGLIGWMDYEPLLRLRDGVVESIDGSERGTIEIRPALGAKLS